jgi:hypothetical protein
VGRQPAPQRHRHDLGSAEVDSRGPGRRPDPHDLDTLSAHRNRRIRRWTAKNKVEPCFTPTNASSANPIEAH